MAVFRPPFAIFHAQIKSRWPHLEDFIVIVLENDEALKFFFEDEKAAQDRLAKITESARRLIEELERDNKA